MESIREISNWFKFFDGQQHSPQALFTSFEAAIARREIPDAKPSRVEIDEASVLGGKREYVRVTRMRYTFDVGAAPFGKGFFVSWWFRKSSPFGLLMAGAAAVLVVLMFGLLVYVAGPVMGVLLAFVFVPASIVGVGFAIRRGILDLEDEILSVPVLNRLYAWFFKPFSYHQQDMERAFQAAMHDALMEVIDELTNTKGIRALSEGERKPVHRELVKR